VLPRLGLISENRIGQIDRHSCVILDSTFVDVAVKRWQEFTGEPAVLDGGRSFDEIAAQRTGAAAA
jgi:hypothetical protein